MNDSEMPRRPFGSEPVIEERIRTTGLRAYHVGFDRGEFRLRPLVDVISSVIPEFALGIHEGTSIPITQVVERLREAAQVVYTTDKYERRGEFGELILHLLLREFCGTVPLVSKIYFKDSANMPAHGFDSVHVSTDEDKRLLWLGESKLYTDGISGVTSLSKDVDKHVNADFLRQEFLLIKRRIPVDFPDAEYWRNLMDSKVRLDEVFHHLVIPMIATYNSDLFIDYHSATDSYFEEFDKDVERLHDVFVDKVGSALAEIVLFLLPVEDKDKLTTELNARLRHMQAI